MKNLAITCILFCFLNDLAVAQFTNLKFENYSTLEGLSSSTCVDIYEDSDGFIWVGTIDGLNKFDGYKFTIYRTEREDSTSISSNRITSIAEDHLGRLWVGTSNGLNVMDRDRDKFTRFRFQDNQAVLKGQDRVNKILFDAAWRELWVATNDGLKRLTMDSSGAIIDEKIFRSKSESSNTLDNTNVISLNLDKRHNLWVGTDGYHLHRYDKKSETFERFELGVSQAFELNHLPKQVVMTDAGDFIVGNDLSRLIIWEQQSQSVKPLDLGQKRPIPIFHIYKDSSGYFWISTDGFGIYILDSRARLIQHIVNSPSDPSSLPNNQPSCVLKDSNGLYWIATYNKGLCKLALSRSAFTHIFHQPGNPNSLSSWIAQSVIRDRKGRVWIGTDGGGLNLYDESNGSFKYFKHDPGNPRSISSDKIVYLHESRSGNIWICSWDGGLTSFNPESGNAINYLHQANDPTSIGQNTVWCAVEDDRGRLWLGTQNAGLDLFIPETHTFYHFTNKPTSPSRVISNLVFSIFIDSNNRLILGTGAGLQVIDLNQLGDDYKAGKLPILKFPEIPLAGIRVNHIAEAPDESFWFGTDAGLYHFDASFRLIKSYSTGDGLPNNLVVGVAVDKEGFIWITTKSGLSRLDAKTDQFNNFNVHDGLQGLEFQSKSIFQTHNGRILIGGINGLNAFYPDQVRMDLKQVKPIISRFRLFNTRVNIDDVVNDRVILDKPINEMDQVDLRYDEGFVTFDFVALNYLNPERVEYAHRMIGVSNDWVYVGNVLTASYSNLTAGNYRFEVKAALDGNWQHAHVAGVDINVSSPPWATWYAYTAYIFMALFITGVVVRYYNKIVQEERQHELDQMKMQFFINVSHEFRTPLTLILNPIERIIAAADNNDVVKASALTIQRSAGKLLNLVNQLLDFRKVDLGKAPLDPLKEDIVHFVKDVTVLFDDLAKAKSIQYSFASNIESFYMWFDPDKLEKIISNLLSNAIKFTPDCGSITVMVNKVEPKRMQRNFFRSTGSTGYVEIVVKDTGIGLTKDQLNMVFQRFFHIDTINTGTGIGLNFSKSLVEQHDGEISVESEYGKGSSFTVRLPVFSKQVNAALRANKEARSAKRVYDVNTVKSLEYEISIANTDTESHTEHARGDQTVLIVEDNKELRLHLKNEFNGLYKIKEASNGKEGFEKAIKFCPDIIVSDVMMPEMDGFEMCRKLKSDDGTSHIPVILLTARTLEEDKLEGYRIGADSYLPKPFNLTMLKARIENLLDARKRLREKFTALSGLQPAAEITTNALDEKFLDRATQIIVEHISDPDFGLEQLLVEIGLSRAHFYRKISSLTGQNPSNFIRTIRLKYAADLLVRKVYSIKEIAYMSGFNSSAYFSKTFRELFGITPNEFIDQHTTGHPVPKDDKNETS